MTPFKASYGCEPPTVFKLEDVHLAVEDVSQTIKERNLIIVELKENLDKAQEYMKASANKKRRDVSFEVRDLVFLKIRTYKLKSLTKKANEKLSPRFYGPCKITEKYGKVAYKGVALINMNPPGLTCFTVEEVIAFLNSISTNSSYSY